MANCGDCRRSSHDAPVSGEVIQGARIFARGTRFAPLLVQPRAIFIALVDAAGSAAFRFPLPPVAPVTIDFQVVTLVLARNGRTAESSNGVRVTIQ